MKRHRKDMTVVAGLLLVAGFALAQTKAPAGLEQLKPLAGEWEGLNTKGKTVRATYKVISGNTAVMETLIPPGEPEMVTVFYPNGKQLFMTHYCTTGNQPRMRAAVANDKEVQFNLLDITNLPTPNTGHMGRMQIEFVDANHINESWIWRENGKDTTEVFHFARRK